jgi:hypothetical protein
MSVLLKKKPQAQDRPFIALVSAVLRPMQDVRRGHALPGGPL